MRQTLVCALITALLTGCAATATPEQVERALPSMSNMEICRGVMIASGRKAELAQGEAARRRLDCAPYFGAIQQQDANQHANQNAAVNNFLQSINPPMQPSTMTNCRTVRIGSTLQTQCW